MEQELEQFRQEVERLRAGRQRGGMPYPEAMRAFAVRYLTQALEAPSSQGWGPEALAGTVEVSEAKKPERPTVAQAGTVTVVAPGGFRVEGLSVEAAAQLLRKLTC